MSEKVKLKRRERAIILMAALFIVAPLAVRPIQKFMEGDRNATANHRPEPWHSYEWATLGVLVFQAWIFHRQARIADRQRRLMKGQLKTAAIAAKAAEQAADAALASLDRPWLSIEGLQNTRTDWLRGMGDLTAQFHISNHGKAPAIIASVNAMLFLGYENPSTAPFSREDISPTILKFPSLGEINSFVTRFAKWPLVDIGDDPVSTAAFVARPVSGPITWIKPLWGPKRFDSPVSLPQGTSTEVYRWRESDLVSARDGVIPDDAWADVFLVGQVKYFGPTIGTEVINFSYKATRFGGFQMHGGAPYNERKKGPDLLGNVGY